MFYLLLFFIYLFLFTYLFIYLFIYFIIIIYLFILFFFTLFIENCCICSKKAGEENLLTKFSVITFYSLRYDVMLIESYDVQSNRSFNGDVTFTLRHMTKCPSSVYEAS